MVESSNVDGTPLPDLTEDLIECMPIGVLLLDAKGRIVRLNTAQERNSRVPREEVVGKLFTETYPKTIEQGLERPLKNLMEHGQGFNLLVDNYLPQFYNQAQTFRCNGAALPSRQYFLLTTVLEEEHYHVRRLVESRTQELQRSKKFLEYVIDSSPTILVASDTKGRIVTFNKTGEQTLGYSQSELKGRNIAVLFGPESFSASVANRIDQTMEVECLDKTGRKVPCLVHVSEVKDESEHVLAILYHITDLSRQKAIEERLKLSEKLAIYSELMGSIAHQLNNPLVGVVNFSELLGQEIANDDPRKDLVETIRKAGRQCLKIVSSVLNSLKDPRLTFNDTDIKAVIETAFTTFKRIYATRIDAVSLHIGIEENLPVIQGDDIQLLHCFVNILANALQAMPRGGAIRVDARWDRAGKMVRVVFSDTGEGIEEENLPKIFLPFFTTKKGKRRYGLGLSFVFQIIKNHRGYIDVSSVPGKGATFTVSLPSS